MLKRIYANNYRCLVNFEANLDRLILLVGPNGGGKSTLFDVLFKIRQLIVDNAKVADVFSPSDSTAWITKAPQSFELDVLGHHGLYSYKLVLSQEEDFNKQHVEMEELLIDGKPLFEFRRGEVNLFRDDNKGGAQYSFDSSVSALATIAPRPDNKNLMWFKNWLKKLFILNLQPKGMTSESREESDWLNCNGTNFASWYRFISQEYQDKIFELTQELREVLPGFHAFKLELAGKHRILKAGFVGEDSNSTPIYFDFEQLSDGQRILIVLYGLLMGLREMGHTIFIDEPDNYIALTEIQPWLMNLSDACADEFSQAVLISHHPELIDYLGPECGKWIERDPLGPARVKKLPERIGKCLKLSEQIARGWTE